MKSKVTAIGKAVSDEGKPMSEVIRDRIKGDFAAKVKVLNDLTASWLKRTP